MDTENEIKKDFIALLEAFVYGISFVAILFGAAMLLAYTLL